MLTSLEWQTLEQQRRISRLAMMYKIQHQLVDIDRDLYLRPGDSRTRVNIGSSRRGPIMTLSETPSSKEQYENGTTYQTPQLGPAPQRSSGLTSNNRLATPTSVNSFNCVIVKCLVVHSLGDISCVCLACLVPQNLKQSATTHVLLLFQNFLQKDMYILDNSLSQWVFHVRTSFCPSYIYLRA